MSHISSAAAASPAAAPGRLGRRERRRAETRERLMRAALHLFAEHGIAGTTVEDITEAADVGKGTFFNYFPTKEHVLLAFGDSRVGKVEAALAEARAGQKPIRDILRRMVHSLAEEHARAPGLLRSILIAFLTSDSMRQLMAAKMAGGRRLIAELVRIGQKRGELRADLPAAHVARVVQQAGFGTMVLWSLDPQGDLFGWQDAWLEMILHGIEPGELHAPRRAHKAGRS
jgi:AcrR family transcriptional regulator